MLQATDIVAEIAYALDRQAEALAAGDFERLEALTALTASLNEELLGALDGLDEAGRVAVAEQLTAAVQRAGQLCDDAAAQRGETRQALNNLRTGQTATAAYRQALPREATLHYSRQG
ncbi:MAG TPA: hypothetical protein VKZ96_06475 [Thermomicrobiales bacterium]|nr:hypothetical protein [Thermomicrobiales bacterium]